MKNKSVIATVILSLSITSLVLLFELSESKKITAAETPQPNKMYPFAEDVIAVATFKFRDATVTYDFQLFDTINNLFGTSASGFTIRQIAPEFMLQKVVGETPDLHKAVDQSFQYGGKQSVQDYPYKEFDVIINLERNGKVLRTLEYSDCFVKNYKIKTEFDKAESFTGKDAFAILEQYTFECAGYKPSYISNIDQQ